MSKNKQARRAREAALKAAQQVGGGCRGHFFGSSVDRTRWPADISELANRIAKEGEKAVPNHDRDLVAKMLPLGSVTRRDGSSVRPRFRDEANL